MHKNILYKLVIILLIFSIIILLSSNVVFAKVNTDIQIGTSLIHEAEPVGNQIVGALQIVGIFVAVAMTMVVGIKYMISSTEKRAEYKKTAICYLVGALLIFGTTGIIKWLWEIFNK